MILTYNRLLNNFFGIKYKKWEKRNYTCSNPTKLWCNLWNLFRWIVWYNIKDIYFDKYS